MATADLTVIALGRADASASRYIAEIQRRLAAQDRVRYTMHAMGTSLEGPTADILAVAGELHAVPFEMGIPRVYSILKLDERRDREQTLEDKVSSVQALLDAGGGRPRPARRRRRASEHDVAIELEAGARQAGDQRVGHVAAVALRHRLVAGRVGEDRAGELARRDAAACPTRSSRSARRRRRGARCGPVALDPDVAAPPVGDADVADGVCGGEGHGPTQADRRKAAVNAG